ncbi:MAG: hypothetical protein JNK78_20260 [Planctomycetes bacterium]|nr:hypothetical protein [Planctomycetota bacterium]
MNRATPAPRPSRACRVLSCLGVIVGLSLAACSGGGGGATTGEIKTGGDFLVLKTEPSNNGLLFLNDPIRIDFSNSVALGSANLSTFSFIVRDQIGNIVNEPVPGTFKLERSPGDVDVGRRLSFEPKLPTNNTFSDGSFKPGRTYEVSLIGGDRIAGTVLLDQSGKGLKSPFTFRVSTADGTTPTQLFRNAIGGGPRRTGLQITPTPDGVGTTAPDGPGVVLNKLGLPPLEIRLLFDQPLNPSTVNVPVGVDTNPLTRSKLTRGRMYLEYADVDPSIGTEAWIPADIELERNDVSGATVVMRPIGVLPNNATIKVVVLETLEDISGESNQNNASYTSTFGTFTTKRSFDQQFAALVEDFVSSSHVDFSAPFLEPLAEVGNGFIKAGFAFEGSPTSLDFDPDPVDTVLNTNFTTVTPKGASPFNVSGGVFSFRNVTIGSGKVVRGQGTNPMVWLVSGTMDVAGTLTVRGGDADTVVTSGNANVPKAGGVGVCGGGSGGAGSPKATERDLDGGGKGNGPLQVPLKGGVGGNIACNPGVDRGSGGGGGSMATQGDPFFKQKMIQAGDAGNTQPIFPQQIGIGGFGGGISGQASGAAGNAARSLNGGPPAAIVFSDSRTDNNFWGGGLDRARNLRIVGELSIPMGGGGGGGGGDRAFNSNCNPDPSFENDSSGGGGGGGGGVLIVKALGRIVIRSTGTISADGGHGGAGEINGASSKGGGGGGGAGGMVVLMSSTGIDINARGNGTTYTYAANNYDFTVSADGGVCRTGVAPNQSKKYPANGVAVPAGSTYDSAPLGGFGGMGIVQLMVPPGTVAPPGTDGTRTIFDDNIRVFQNGVQVSGATKEGILAWRGYPNAVGQLVDDNNNLLAVGDEGDIRPSPMLLPVPFAARSRLRSQWIDTGATSRRDLLAEDLDPRGVVTSGGAVAGPQYEFAGLDTATGYASFTVQANTGRLVYPTVVNATGILTRNENSSFQGKPAYRVELTSAVLGDIADRYSHYEAELLNATGSVVGSFEILSHTNRTLVLSTEGGALPASATQARVLAKFFKVITNGVEGLGATYLSSSGDRLPNSNVKIGFAFHQNPASATATRFPAAANTFVYDLSNPSTQQAIRNLHAPFVQWDIIFDGEFRVSPSDGPPALGPATPRPEIHFLRLPFRF